MNKLLLLAFFATLCFVVVSCGEEDAVVGPTVDLISGPGLLSSETVVQLNATIDVQISANSGDNPLKDFTIKEDGVIMDVDRLTINGSQASTNPFMISGVDSSGFSGNISIDAQNDCGDVKVYIFEASDTELKLGTASLLIRSISPPELIIDGPDEYLATPDTVAGINLETTLGSADLYSISVSIEDADGNFNLIPDTDGLFLGNQSTNFDSNPHILSGDDQGGFTKVLFVRPDYIGYANYRIELEDVNGKSVSKDIAMTSGTFFSTMREGVLNNADWINNSGGLDLDLPLGGVSFDDPSAEIRDAGIDGGSPDVNWIQRIAGVNGVSIRKINDVLPAGVDFDDLEFIESVVSNFDAAPDFDFDIDGVNYSDVVELGDIFAVRSDSIDYLLRVAEIDVDLTDNSDFYVFDVKF